MKPRHLVVILLLAAILMPACGATAVPTAAPTSVPPATVAAPTTAPTVAPTKPPAPTAAPTVAPTAAPTSAPTTKPTAAPVKGGVLNVAVPNTATTADGATTTNDTASIISINIDEWLVALGENYQPVPMLAESYKVSEDGLTWTFTLRKGLKFSNGQPMTSDDVIASYDRFRKVGVRAADFNAVTDRSAPDAYTVVFKTKTVVGTFLVNIANIVGSFPILSKAIIIGADGQPKAANSLKVPDEIVGMGPYKLVEYKPDTVVVLKRNEFYQPLAGANYDGLGGAKTSYFDEVRINIVPDRQAQAAGLESGVYDYIYGLSLPDFKRLRDNPVAGVTVSATYPGMMMMLWFNHASKFGGNLKFRQALQAALNVEEVGLLDNNGDKDLFRLNPYLWPKEGAMYLPNDPVAEALYNQNNPTKGKQLLTESGYNGEELVYITSKGEEYMYRQAVAITDQLTKKLGLKIKLDVYEWAAYVQKVAEKDTWTLSGLSYAGYNYTPNGLRTYFHSSSTSAFRLSYSNPAMDKALDDAAAAVTKDASEKAWREVQKIYYQDVTNIKLYDTPQPSGSRSNIMGFKPYVRPRFFGAWRQK